MGLAAADGCLVALRHQAVVGDAAGLNLRGAVLEDEAAGVVALAEDGFGGLKPGGGPADVIAATVHVSGAAVEDGENLVAEGDAAEKPIAVAMDAGQAGGVV